MEERGRRRYVEAIIWRGKIVDTGSKTRKYVQEDLLLCEKRRVCGSQEGRREG